MKKILRPGIKKLLVLLSIVISVFSCSLDDEENYHYELVASSSVEIPEQMTVNETREITIYYMLESDCYTVTQLDYRYSDQFERTVALVAVVRDNSYCQSIANEVFSETFDFTPTTAGMYTFKILNGFNEDTNEYTYAAYQIEVLEEE